MTNRQWVNTDDDGAIYALLRRLTDRVAVDAIDTLWLFPTRRTSGIESTVCVISAFDLGDEHRRRVGAVRWLVTRDRRGNASVEENVYEYATAPNEAVPKVVDGVMRRLGSDALEPPRSVEVGGDPVRWTELLREFGAPETVEEAGTDDQPVDAVDPV